ncbi:UvrD-like helicase, ATP-binding domain, P-loop containing nucleoside triphosphate hydrolase [Tanacetum coccineum]
MGMAHLYNWTGPSNLVWSNNAGNSKPSVLCQLFVSVSPRLCYAVKQHVFHLTSSSVEVNLDSTDVIPSEFDDTTDTSFFERFCKASEDCHGNYISSSVGIHTFIRSREVTFDKFCSLYWPHFDTNLTKKLNSSRAFTEIISHIKGGLLAGECSDGKVSYEGYCLLAKSRSSTLTKEKREIVYNLFQAYEKMKSERWEFDLGDFVNDIHRRLKNGNYKGDQMDFVYIDEVQDLSMRQLSLFKYICQNVDEGFMFAGDTAQTIAKGIDFRFQDIRSLFYKEFLSTRTSEMQEKGLVSEIKQLKQNFRTHAGVLDLAQSFIDIMYHYYIQSIDKLEPEISLISDELTSDIGLEFQDVLLYNFFGTSPLKDQCRVICGYMKKSIGSKTRFLNASRHFMRQDIGRSSYARAMIELRSDVELKDNIVADMPKIVEEGYYTHNICVEYCGNVLGNKNKNVKPTNEVSKSNSFDALNLVDNDVEFGTNRGYTHLASQEANSSSSTFWNADSSSPSTTTPIIEKINKMENLIIDGKAILVNNEGKPLSKVDDDSEDEVATVDNEMAGFLAKEDGYGQEIPKMLQAFCNRLDINVRGRMKK